MEGIAGTYGHSDRALARKMLDVIWHRGPDTFRIAADDRAVLGARELATTEGSRPVGVYEDRGLAVASDSCIFNKAVLLSEYIGDSGQVDVPDALLVMEMYRREGRNAFARIDGGFAIAVIDDGELVLARDKYGLKPLYISRNIRKGCFSSEMKSQVLAGEPFVQFPPGKSFVPSHAAHYAISW